MSTLNWKPQTLDLPERALDLVADYIGVVEVDSITNLHFWYFQSPIPVIIRLSRNLSRPSHLISYNSWIAVVLKFVVERKGRNKHSIIPLAIREGRPGQVDIVASHHEFYEALTSAETSHVGFFHLDCTFDAFEDLLPYAPFFEMFTSLELTASDPFNLHVAPDTVSKLFSALSKATKLIRINVSMSFNYKWDEVKPCLGMVELSKMKCLRFLELSFTIKATYAKSLVEFLAKSPKLIHLELQLGDSESCHLFADHIKTNTTLKSVNYTCNGWLEDTGGEATGYFNAFLNSLCQNSSLRSLELYGRDEDTSGNAAAFASMIKTNNTLTSISTSCFILLNEDDAEALAMALAVNNKLRTLKMGFAYSDEAPEDLRLLKSALMKHKIHSSAIIKEYESSKLEYSSSYPYFILE